MHFKNCIAQLSTNSSQSWFSRNLQAWKVANIWKPFCHSKTHRHTHGHRDLETESAYTVPKDVQLCVIDILYIRQLGEFLLLLIIRKSPQPLMSENKIDKRCPRIISNGNISGYLATKVRLKVEGICNVNFFKVLPYSSYSP